jgi:hypothetical protein
VLLWGKSGLGVTESVCERMLSLGSDAVEGIESVELDGIPPCRYAFGFVWA